ncbi:MAG: tetratricopeptide repeat protein [Candidatus Latescibacteria bacterium]|nr:tetratricopeptide repeat protein [Candidatus Latescibacterota bacterium]MBT4139256.1 tetratricopeptide repeat protein [Candidatus Latescibacterota bacterium]
MQNPNKIEEEEPQEELLVWFLNLWGKVEQNYTQILAGVGVVVVAVLVVVFVNNHQNQETQEARSELGNVYIALFEGRIDDAINQSQTLSDEYAGNPIGREALIALANLQFEQKSISVAQANFQRFLDEYSSEGLLGYGAWSGLASCLEAEAKFAEAAAKFKSYADAHPNTPFAPVALKEAGRCYQLGQNNDQAQVVYQIVLDKYKDSSVLRNVKNELLMMGIDVEG